MAKEKDKKAKEKGALPLDEITLGEHARVMVEEYTEAINGILDTMNDLSKLRRVKHKKMWDIIRTFHPETEGWNCHYNSQTGKVILLHKEKDDE